MKLTLPSLYIVALMCAFHLRSDLVQEIQRRLDDYYGHRFMTKTHLFFNQPSYLPGDTVFFSARLLFAEELTPVPGDHLLTLAIKGAIGSDSLRQVIGVRDGMADNYFVLPDSLPEDVYIIAAFPEWQKEEPKFAAYYALPVGGNPIMGGFPESSYGLYPEGGRLIGNVLNRISVIGPKNYTAGIFSDGGSRIGTVSTNENGIGSFVLAAKVDERYFVTLNRKRFVLPEVKRNAIGVRFNRVSDSTAELLVQPSETGEHGTQTITFTHHSTVHLSATVTLRQDKPARIAIPLAQLPQGLIVAAVWNEHGAMQAERIFYNAHDSKSEVIALPDQTEAGTREEITVSLENTNIHSEARLSIRVVADEVLPDHHSEAGMSTALWQDIPFGKLGLDPFEKYDLPDLDLVLNMFSWERFELNSLLNYSDSVRTNYVSPGLSISGRILSPNDNNKFSEPMMVSVFLEDEGIVLEGNADHLGNFSIPIPFDVHGTVNAFFIVTRRGKRMEGLSVELNRFMPLSPITVASEARVSPREGYPYGEFRANVNRIEKVYTTFARHSGEVKPVGAHNPLISLPSDAVISVKDYELFPTMEETIREIVPLLRHRRIKGKHEIRVWHDDKNEMAEEPPLYIIDGKMTDETDYFMNINPSQIDQIRIISSQRGISAMGQIARNGLVVVTTYGKGDKAFPANNRLTFTGLPKKQTFKNISASHVAQKRVPLMRSCLYWNPDLVIPKGSSTDIRFYTPDNPGRYIITGNGFSSTGKFIEIRDTIEVSYEPRGR